MKDHQTPTSFCPYCKHQFDMAMNAAPQNNVSPKPGDISLCLECAKILVFDENIKVRKPTPEEMERALKMPALTRAQMVIANVTYDAPWNKEKRRKNEHTDTETT